MPSSRNIPHIYFKDGLWRVDGMPQKVKRVSKERDLWIAAHNTVGRLNLALMPAYLAKKYPLKERKDESI